MAADPAASPDEIKCVKASSASDPPPSSAPRQPENIAANTHLKVTAAALNSNNMEVVMISPPQKVGLEHFAALATSDAVFKNLFSGSGTSPQGAFFFLALKSVNVWRSESHCAHFSGPVPCLVPM